MRNYKHRDLILDKYIHWRKTASSTNDDEKTEYSHIEDLYYPT